MENQVILSGVFRSSEKGKYRRTSEVSQGIIIKRLSRPMASVYEKATRMVIESYYSQVAEEIVSRLKSGIILDLGTGLGYLPIEIVKVRPPIKAVKLGFADGFYEMVVSTGMLHSLKNPVKVMNECYRVLKLGGEAGIYDPAKVSSQIDMKKWKASLSFGERFFYRFFTLFKLFNLPHIYSREQVIEMIAATKARKYQIAEGTTR